MMTEEALILQLSKRIMTAYFEELDLTPLFSHLSDDVIWAGAGKHMQLTGYEAVTEALRRGHSQRVPCRISNEEYTVRPLSDTTWLCQICSDITTDPSCNMFIHEYQRCVFIFQKTQRCDDGWEIIYLNNSVAYNRLNDQELFAVEYGMHNFQQRAEADGENVLTTQDKYQLYSYIKRNAFANLDAAGKNLFLALSLFPSFTGELASYVMDSPRAKDLLDAEVERNPFLYFDYHDGTYSFHPLLASYLHYVFSRKSRRWQQAQQLRAAHWYLQEGDYKQAIVLARRAGNYDTVLTAIEQGGRESLYGFAHDVAADTLQHASAAERAAHLEGCFYCVLYAFRCGKRLLAVKYLSVLADCVETEFADAAQRLYYAAYAEVMKGFCSYPDLSAMTKHVQRARELLPSPHDLILPWTFGSPSPLSLYHSLPGQLEQTAEGLRQFTASYIRLIHADVFPCQTDFIRGEYEYLTGRLDEAEQTLTQYVHANSIVPKCISHLQTAHFYLARLALCRGDAAALQKEAQHLHSLKLQVYPQCGTAVKHLCEAFLQSMLNSSSASVPLYTSPPPPIDVNGCYYPIAPIAAVIQDKVLLSRGEFPQLLLQATEHYKTAMASQYILPAIYESILLACVYEHAGNIDGAATALKQAIVLAQPDHLVMPFAEHAEYLPQTMKRLCSDAATAPFIEQAQGLSLAEPLSTLRTALAKPALPLSKREQEVAAMVATGLTNKAIAGQLNIAEVTVKKTLSQIYKKLGITNRAALSHYMSHHPAG